MAVHKTIKQSDLQRKLKILEYQLYGKKEQVSKLAIRQSGNSENLIVQSQSDLIYLKQDLTKIALLASLAIGIQIILYFSSLSKLVKLF